MRPMLKQSTMNASKRLRATTHRHQLLKRKRLKRPNNVFCVSLQREWGYSHSLIYFMTTFQVLLDRLNNFHPTQEVYTVIDNSEPEMVALNIKQLMASRNRLGDFLSPKISEDPYFKTKEAAKAYADRKKRMYPETPYDRPNLRINGFFHSTIEATRMGASVKFDAMAGFTPSIDAKYNNTALGLSPDSKSAFSEAVILPEVLRQMKIKTGLGKK